MYEARLNNARERCAFAHNPSDAVELLRTIADAGSEAFVYEMTSQKLVKVFRYRDHD